MKNRSSKFPLAPLKSTFSIVAVDPSTKQLGVAVESKAFAVGALVPWVRACVGAVATQARTLARYGPLLLDTLAKGEHPQAALDAALVSDSNAAHRQIGIISAGGDVANHTGAECLEWAGARTGEGFSIQGNLLAGAKVVDSMADAFSHSSGTLAERLLVSLEAGQDAGGDKRGQQAAALVVEQLGYKDIGVEGIDRLVDLRIDDHTEPIKELRRLFGLWQVRDLHEQAMRLYNAANYSAATDIMAEVNNRSPNTPSILYNLACFECRAGHSAESLNHLRQAIKLESSWREFAKNDSDFEAIRDMPEFTDLISA
jgi:uncharacterized Ntn-hydrolase superfamily protein